MDKSKLLFLMQTLFLMITPLIVQMNMDLKKINRIQKMMMTGCEKQVAILLSR
ncbi:hypothetical protein Hanom_Chr16g01515681 [Helianthus anomalus]